MQQIKSEPLTYQPMKRYILIISLLMSMTFLHAQDKGYVTGSFETSDHIYSADALTNFVPDDDPFGSNNDGDNKGQKPEMFGPNRSRRY